jgi:hypothetical protein
VASIVLATLLTGCRGHASVYLVPLTSKKISPSAPVLLEITADECYYWVGEDGRRRVAIKDVSGRWGGRYIERNIHLSLLLEAPLAGAERMYQGRKNTARLRARLGPAVHIRSASLRGIVAVSRKGEHAPIEGRFRLFTRQQSYHVLMGWSGDQNVLVTGSFHAVENRAKGEAILQYTEEGTLARSPGGDVTEPIRLSPPPD